MTVDGGMDSLDELAELLGATGTLPVLFVGSGLSRRYLGSPDWDGLIQYSAELTELPLDYYSGQLPSDMPKEDRLPAVASLIAKQFHEEWWTTEKFRGMRESNDLPLPGSGDPLKLMISKFITSLSYIEDDPLAVERAKLGRAKVHAIITTNYDEVLEEAFSDYRVFVGQQDVLFASPQYVGEIYKIHGSAVSPTSLVFTGDDYIAYRKKNPYLIAKIMTLFVEHPVLFIGYSLRDPHILDLLATLVSCLSPEQLDTFNQRLIFVGRVSSARAKGLSTSSITVPGYTFEVREFGIDDFGGVYEVLAELPEHYPVKLLRNLKERVTQMAYSDTSSERVHVLPLQEGENIDDVQVVVGVGAFERLGEKGYTAYSRAEFFLDMIAGAPDHSVDHLGQLIAHSFRNAKFSPVFYPLHLAQSNGAPLEVSALPARAQALIRGDAPLEPYPGKRPQGWENLGFRDLLATHPKYAENLSTGCSYDIDDVIELGKYLWPRFVGNSTPSTPLAKAACKFDRLVYGEDFAGDRATLRETVRRELGTPRY
ncbi:SIR2 family protein [Microbacterium testaceum]|nr:SIR2 family protein [Microbacterium testaceum]